jgi:ABC-type lipoprotein export system ATPase subunit
MLVELAHVHKSYGTPPVEVLRDINFQLAAGEAVAMIGPSGSGKSTLLNLIGALDQPTRGTVRFDGRDLAGRSEAELAGIRNHEIGFIFQLHHLLPQCTVLENVLIPTLTDPAVLNTPAARQRAERLLNRVGLKPRQHARPGQLSGGERQRTAVVRALINQPKLLLADEPTGSLDQAAADNLARLLVELNHEERVALVVVTHSRELAGAMGRILELRNGVLRHPAAGEAAMQNPFSSRTHDMR